MKKLILSIVFLVSVIASFGQTGSLSQSVYRSRVNDSTSVTTPSGYGLLYYNNQRAIPKWIFSNDEGTTWQELGSGSNSLTTISSSVFMFSGIDSDLTGYESATSLSSYTPAALSTSGTTVTTTPTLIEEFATASGQPGVTVIPIGIINVHYDIQKSAGSNNYYSYAEVYKRVLAGTETLLGTTDISSQSAVNTVLQTNVSLALTDPVFLLSTDRIIVKVYGVMLSSSATITLNYDDNTNARVEIPVNIVSGGGSQSLQDVITVSPVLTATVAITSADPVSISTDDGAGHTTNLVIDPNGESSLIRDDGADLNGLDLLAGYAAIFSGGTTHGNAVVKSEISGGTTATATLEAADNGATNTSSIVATPTTLAVKIGNDLGGSGDVLKSDGAGGVTWQPDASGGGLTVGTTAIASGTTTRVLYDNAGTLGEYSVSGSGNVAMSASPTFTGSPLAPNQNEWDISTKLATTNYVDNYKLPRHGIDFSKRKIAIFGTSITAGVGSTGLAFSYAKILCQALGAIEENFGLNGSTLMDRVPVDPFAATNMVDRIASIPTKTTAYALLIFEFGVNDIGQNSANYTAENYITDYTTVLNGGIAKGWSPKEMLLIAPWWITPAGYTYYQGISGTPLTDDTRAEVFREATKTVASNFGALYIDPSKHQVLNDPTLTADGVHPNDYGHSFSANELVEFLTGHGIYGESISGIKQFTATNQALRYNTARILGSATVSDGVINEFNTATITAGANSQLLYGGGAISPTYNINGKTGISTIGWAYNPGFSGTPGANYSFVSSSGFMGLGTLTPSVDFHIQRSNAAAFVTAQIENTSGTGYSLLRLKNNSANTFDLFLSGGSVGTSGLSTANQPMFTFPASTTNPLFRMDNNQDLIFAHGGFGTGNESVRFKRVGATFTQQVLTSAWAPAIVVTPGAHTGMTTATEFPNLKMNTATQTAASGTTATQRNFWVEGMTYAGTSGTRTITNSYTGYFGSAIAGPNGAITNNFALGLDGNLSLVTAGNKIYIKEGTNGSSGQIALTAGVATITISGVTTSTRAQVTFVAIGGTVTTTWQYKAVCTANTLTITAIDNTGATNTLDTSTLNYFIIEPAP